MDTRHNPPAVTTITGTWMSPRDTADPAVAQSVDPREETLRQFGAHGAAILGFCRAMIARTGEAEDVVQETFLKLLVHLEAGGDRANLRAWLFTVAANACRDRLKRARRWLPWPEHLELPSMDPPDDAPELGPARLAFRRLKPRDRLLLGLRGQGLSYREIAQAARLGETSVGKLLARAADRWKRAMEKHS